ITTPDKINPNLASSRSLSGGQIWLDTGQWWNPTNKDKTRKLNAQGQALTTRDIEDIAYNSQNLASKGNIITGMEDGRFTVAQGSLNPEKAFA
ncbi:hypothetical protein, partial [Tritonibacter sp. SIMBA_163]|uniref:hypothetical protein n=1 Tax=Tritonibacter sp. SIMBA_163 TaxID=3080868 RepID=UPI00397EDDE1